MTDQEFALLAEGEAAAALGRAAHLVMLLALDSDPVAFQREIQQLAIGDDADPMFSAAVAAYAVQIAAKFAAVWPRDGVQDFLGELMASNPPSDLRDIGGTT